MAQKKKTQKVKKESDLDKGLGIDTIKTSKLESNKSSKPRPKVFKLLLLIIVFFILGGIIYKNKGLIIIGTIDGKPVTSIELYNRMVKQYGKQTFDQMIAEQIIINEANKRGIAVSDQDIDQEISKIEQNLGESTTLADAISQQGMTIDDLRSQIKIRLTATKLVQDKIEVNDSEIDAYLKNNKEFMDKEQDEAKQKEQIKQFLTDQKVNQQIQQLVSELRQNSQVASYL